MPTVKHPYKQFTDERWRLVADVSRPVADEFRRVAKAQGRTMQALMRLLIAREIARHNEENS